MFKLIALLLSLVMITGCSPNAPTIQLPDSPTPPVIDTESKNHPDKEPITNPSTSNIEVTENLTSDFVNGNFLNNSAVMVDNLYNDENIMISPMSIYMALGMAASGADTETLEEFEKFLGMSISDFESKIKEVLDSLPEQHIRTESKYSKFNLGR